MMSGQRRIRLSVLVVLAVFAGTSLVILYCKRDTFTSSDATDQVLYKNARNTPVSLSSASTSTTVIAMTQEAQAVLGPPKKPDSLIELREREAANELEFLQREIRKRLPDSNWPKGVFASSRPKKQEPATKDESSASEKLNPVLSKPLKNTPLNRSPSSYPRCDKEGRILVRVRYDAQSISKESIEEMISKGGGSVYAHIPREGLLEAYLRQNVLNDWASHDWVKRIDPVGPAVSRVGSITTEADNLLGVQLARQQFDVDGRGVRIGVISTGVDNLAQSQASGDLPSDVVVLANGGWFEPDDEGTAMLEIIHDLAPGAKLYFHDGGSETRFRMAVNAFIDNGCDIIVDDIGYNFEPYFEDGPVAQTVADAVSDGIVFVSAAGNQAKRHAEFNWRSTHDDPNDINLYEYLFGVPALVFPNDEEMIVFELGPLHAAFGVLQWSERFGQAAHDYDIFIYDYYDCLNFFYDVIVWYDWEIYGYYDWYWWGYWYDSFGYIHFGEPPYPSLTVLLSSENIQNGSGDPIEALQGVNDSFQWNTYVMVVEGYGSPSTSDRLEMNFRDWGYSEAINLPGEEGTPVGSIFGHAAVPGVLAVGAINANDAGLDNIEEFSSQGPCYVPFSSETWRAKPDLCALDGVSVTGAGGFPSPFLGTSAAAPHVAGIAALIKNYNPSLSGGDISRLLKDTANDLGSSGHDSVYGYGRVNVERALEAVTPIGLEDAIQALRIMTGIDSAQSRLNDVNGDSKIGIEEAIYVLQRVAGLR